jgi:hypothetical protein
VLENVLGDIFCNDQPDRQGVGTPLGNRIEDESEDKEQRQLVIWKLYYV